MQRTILLLSLLAATLVSALPTECWADTRPAPTLDTLPAPAVQPPHNLIWRPGHGYLLESELPADWTFDVDDFLRRYSTEEPGTGTLPEELNYYYDDYVMHLGEEGKQREVERMRAAARKYKSQRLTDEIRFLQAFVIYRNVAWGDDIAHGRKVADELEAEGKLILAIRLRYDLLRKTNLGFDDLYHQAFRVAGELLDDLERVTDREFIYKRAAYSEMGHLHYTFRDYEKAVPLLRKALVDHAPHFFDRSNLRARNTLAVYYHAIDSLDRAEHYYRSILASPDTVYSRAMFNAIAWTGLGRIAAQRGNCNRAMPLYEAALPVSLRTNDHNFAAGILISMGECHLAAGDLRRTRDIIDTTLVWMRNPQKYISTHRYRKLYPLIGRYYLRQGDIATFERYADSTAQAEKHYQEVHNARVILRAKDEIFAAEKQLRDEQITAQRRSLTLSRMVIVLAAIGIVLLAIALGIRVVYSRRLADKVRGLMEQLSRNEKASTVGAGPGKVPVPGSPAASKPVTGDSPALYQSITTLMHQQHLYTNPDLTRREVATLLGTNENYLAKAIKQNTGLTFSEYLYYLRLEHAARLLATPGNDYTIEVIATESGYRSRKTFHQHFRNRFGCTPDEYRQQGGKG